MQVHRVARGWTGCATATARSCRAAAGRRPASGRSRARRSATGRPRWSRATGPSGGSRWARAAARACASGRVGIRASSLPPPLATSKRMTALRRRLAGRVLEHDLRARRGSRGSRPGPRPARPGAAGSSCARRAARAARRRWRSGASGGRCRAAGRRARVGRVQEAQPVDPAVDAHARRHRAVDEDRVAAEAEVDVLGVAERAVAVERVVGDHERDVVLALGQLELLLAVVAEQVGADEAVVERPRGPAVRVVVVPEGRRVLVVRVRVVERAAGRDDVHRVAVVLRRDVAAVQVDVAVERQPVALRGRSRRGPCARGSSGRDRCPS